MFSEVIPHTASVDEIKARDPLAVVLSGGPASVYAEGAPQLDPALFDLGVPVFGICYGFQSDGAGARWAPLRVPAPASTAELS